MNELHEQPDRSEHRLDTATSVRLARLADRPVDTASLEQRLASSALDEAPAAIRPPAWWWRSRRMMQAAAVVALMVLAGWMVMQTSSPAIAAPADLAEIHHLMLEDQLDTTPVTSVEAANAAIARQWARAPHIPEAPGARVRACCLHEVQGARLIVVGLEYQDQSVKLAVARSRDIASPAGRVIERDGRDFIIHEYNGVTMAMTNHGDRWLCVMGELAEEELVALAGRVVF